MKWSDSVHIIGIDPGKSGGIAVLNNNGQPVEYLVMPLVDPSGVQWTMSSAHKEDRRLPKSRRGVAKSLSIDNLSVGLFLAKYAPCCVFIERQAIYTRSGKGAAQGALAIGVNYGLLLAECRRHDCHEIDPNLWYRRLGLVKSTDNDKPALAFCLRRGFPLPAKQNGSPLLREAEGVADAWAIAWFGQQVITSDL